MSDIYIRKATSSDSSAAYQLVCDGYSSLVWPIFKNAVRRGYTLHMRGVAISAAVIAWASQAGASRADSVLWGLLSYVLLVAVLRLYVWSQMTNEARKSLEHGLGDIDGYYSGKGSYMWVVCQGEEPSEGDTDTAAATAPVIACVALRKDKVAGEATLQHLAVAKSEQRKGIATTLMKHVTKHAKAQGVTRIIARCSSGQVAARTLLTRKAGFKEVLVTPVNSWFSVHKLQLDVR